MNKSFFINIASVVVILLSVSAWYFLLPGFLSQHTGADVLNSAEGEVKVEGAKTASDEEMSQPEKSVTFGELLSFQPDAPVRNESVGEVYMRAGSAIAIDANTGTILHYQDGKRRMAIASLTKVMTAIVAIEHIKDLEKEIVSIKQEAVSTAGTKVGCPSSNYCISNRLQVGEKVTAKDLFDSMLIGSANDAAISLGLHIAGSQKDFANLMNDKAREIGLSDTHFCNPSGLDEEGNLSGCYSTAYDVARIAAYSMRYDAIWETMKVKEKEFVSQDGTISHRIVSTDRLLDQLPNCLGGKTGFTYEAGKSLMMAVHHPVRRDHRVIAVVLNDNYRWADMKIMFDWVFNAYSWPAGKFVSGDAIQ